MLCIEKERVEAILMKPEIWRVPDASEEILGIAVYNGKLVIYYRFDCNRRRSAVFLSGTTAEGSMELPRRRLGKKVFPGRSWSP